ncbi:MAG: DNA polymerase, partial [Planctomycetota bacterium]|nr:DNA polymerase [Planctomycetota bacterium]
RAEREAVNTVIQGSAADLIKTAMVRLHQKMQKETPRSRMLLQIHDELVFESPPAEAKKLAALVKCEMENAIPLDVPIVVEIGEGSNWLEAK